MCPRFYDCDPRYQARREIVAQSGSASLAAKFAGSAICTPVARRMRRNGFMIDELLSLIASDADRVESNESAPVRSESFAFAVVFAFSTACVCSTGTGYLD